MALRECIVQDEEQYKRDLLIAWYGTNANDKKIKQLLAKASGKAAATSKAEQKRIDADWKRLARFPQKAMAGKAPRRKPPQT